MDPGPYPAPSMSKRTRNLHAWKTRLPDGRSREVHAQLHASKWTVTSRDKGEEGWTTHDPPRLEDLVDLHEVLFNKYQRKHLAWEHLQGVRKLIEAKAGPGAGEELGLSEV